MSATALLLYVGTGLGLLAIAAGVVRRPAPAWPGIIAALLFVAVNLTCAVGGWSPFLEADAALQGGAAVAEKMLASTWWGLAACATGFLLQFTLGHDGRSRQSRLLSDLLSAALYVGALLAVLTFVLKLPLSGLLATSGIAAVVLGLALQSTLSDLFSGIAVGVEQPFRVGDRISIGEHIEGTVSQINWRSIRISTDEDDVAIIPNSAVAKAEIVNRSYPTHRQGRRVEINASAAAVPERVQTLIGHALLLVPDVLADPAPSINLKRLGSRINGYDILYFIDGKTSSGRVRSDVLRQVRARLLHAGLLEVQIPPAGGAGRGGFETMDLFEGLGAGQLERLRSMVVTRQLETGDILFAEGDADDNLYIVTDGVLEVRRTAADGRLEIGARIGSGEFLGAIGVMTGDRKQVMALAAAPARVALLSKTSLAPLLRDAPSLLAKLAESARRGYVLIAPEPGDRDSDVGSSDREILPRIRAFFRFHHGQGGSSGSVH